MSMWINKFTCTVFVFCPRKTHPKGKEYHAIYCGENGIIYVWYIDKIKKCLPIPIGRPEF